MHEDFVAHTPTINPDHLPSWTISPSILHELPPRFILMPKVAFGVSIRRRRALPSCHIWCSRNESGLSSSSSSWYQHNIYKSLYWIVPKMTFLLQSPGSTSLEQNYIWLVIVMVKEKTNGSCKRHQGDPRWCYTHPGLCSVSAAPGWSHTVSPAAVSAPPLVSPWLKGKNNNKESKA